MRLTQRKLVPTPINYQAIYNEIAGMPNVAVFPDEPFASYFSGNTVQICPVGALTAKPYRFKARPWDLEQSESTCQSCAVGCRVAVQSSRNEVLRYLGVDVDPVNWGWLCDKGRFDFEAVNSDRRLQDPLVRRDGAFVPVRWTDALAAASSALQGAIDARPGSIGVLGGARLSNESAYAWAKRPRASSAPATSTASSPATCPRGRARSAEDHHRRLRPGWHRHPRRPTSGRAAGAVPAPAHAVTTTASPS
jgi:NADH dehydrogenase/NADH:ubiquinone oxidoreductase subunit G